MSAFIIGEQEVLHTRRRLLIISFDILSQESFDESLVVCQLIHGEVGYAAAYSV